MTDTTPTPDPTRDEAVLPSEITEAQINSACLSYRHDFGLLDDHDKERLRFVAKEWLHAWRKEFDPMAPALKISASAPAPASGGVDAVAVSRMDVVIALREWFGGERYARDYEYLDMQMGPQMKATLEAVFKDRRERASLSPAATPVQTANCCHCGRIIDTRETTQGGDEFGAELSDGRWTCSPECWDAVVEPAATPVSEAAAELRVRHPTRRGPFVISDAELDAALAKPASLPAGGLTEAEMVEKTAAALVVMARCNIPPDVQELLVAGNPDRSIPPGILKRVLAEADGRQVKHGALSQSTSAGRVGE